MHRPRYRVIRSHQSVAGIHMQTYPLTTFLAEVKERARLTGVANLPVDALRNKGGNRTAQKRALLARAAARNPDGNASVISYF
jgi:hypothetical protein